MLNINLNQIKSVYNYSIEKYCIKQIICHLMTRKVKFNIFYIKNLTQNTVKKLFN
jgi:hypothetical protein